MADLDEQARERFEADTAEHEMDIVRDDGPYRHVRFQKPGTSIYHYDLVTWPGYLVICGDMGTYAFSRIRDMFDFFSDHGYGINPQYWSEKLQAPGPLDVRVYSEAVFRARVLGWVREASEEMEPRESTALRAALSQRVLIDEDYGCPPSDEVTAQRLLSDFEHEGRRIDAWEWDLREYDFRFLWCCWAILRGIAQYRTAVVTA